MHTKNICIPLYYQIKRTNQMTNEFNEFAERITSQISQYAELHGSIGTGYMNVLVFKDGKFQIIGEMLYNIYREHLHKYEKVCPNTPEEFGIACNDFLNGKRETMPSWCYKGSGLIELS